MTQADPTALISTEQLAAQLGAADLRIVDGSFKMPGVTPTAIEDYRSRHLPGAVFFDIETIADAANPLPHMLPNPTEFAAKMGALGIGDADRVVVYDSAGLVSAGRVWWMFRAFGHDKVQVLDGGLPKWLAEGRPTDAIVPTPLPGKFTARFHPEMLRAKQDLLDNLATRREQVIDARATPRFEGSVAEPRPGLRAGHIPGSFSLPSDQLIDRDAKTVLPATQLRALFEAAGVDLARPIVTSCGSGVTAGALALALHLIGHKSVALYDGSWSEWGLPGETPVATGPATPP
ncbi:MAG: 3-mercaptopyruvate sulfurtransferase [Rhodospirillales bacterium]|jgi:thiosulfate/3-mercaptopyruvate sulfurtransferase|nr:3-mercaptopyruvate sulfurtransferase [Rhodospirillales bacterium]